MSEKYTVLNRLGSLRVSSLRLGKAFAFLAVVLVAWAAIDVGAAWRGGGTPVTCALIPAVQLLAMAAAFVLFCVGLVVWVFSRFASRESVLLMGASLFVATAPMLLGGLVISLIAAGCID